MEFTDAEQAMKQPPKSTAWDLVLTDTQLIARRGDEVEVIATVDSVAFQRGPIESRRERAVRLLNKGVK